MDPELYYLNKSTYFMSDKDKRKPLKSLLANEALTASWVLTRCYKLVLQTKF
ncbi:hypothetical protein LDG_5794 [Legionella drancourtii LLAP12]|uniref:Uncharacterized protein n=1 Tax=Legionella drancourtii LLAP12 TaxID=658187 RepID=G9EKQ5_9GAMM|nr:hypothetical protein LDG_5794 [Legionella drancourtii LLAP12]